MQVGDLVKFVGQLGLGVIVEHRINSAAHGRHNYRVLFSGTGYKELDGYHWCDPSTLEKI